MRVVLVQPKNEGNLAAVARAMKNFGVKELVLVKPCRLGAEARQRAMRGVDILDVARTVGDLETSPHDRGHEAREARSVRHGERETPRGVQVVARGDELSGPQTSSHASHVPPHRRPRGPEQVGIPCAHGCDSAGGKTDSALGAQGLADRGRADGEGRIYFATPMPRDRSVFSMLFRPSFSSTRSARIASTFSGTTSDSWCTAWK